MSGSKSKISKTAKILRLAALAAVIALPSGLVVGQTTNPVDAGFVILTRQEVSRIFSLPGRAVAYQQVRIRPRVNGVIQKIIYDPTVPLAVGDPMFTLDDARYVAAVASAQAQVTTAEAEVAVAKAGYERAVGLKGSGYTAAQVEQAKATLNTSQASLTSAKAALEFAKTELSWTTIKSPIAGMADVANVSAGDLVTSAQVEALTVVTRLDPIDVTMQESSSRILKLRREVEAGTLKISDRLKAELVLETGETFASEGTFVASGNTVSTATGTAPLRFRFGNPDKKILPGMFLRGDIVFGKVDAFLVPQRAATRGNTGRLTALIVDKDNIAKQVEFSENGTYKNNWLVTAGFAEGDRLIVDGLETVRPGNKINPIAATIDAAGLVVDKVSTGGAKK